MGTLTERDLGRVLEFVHEVHSFDDLPALRGGIARGLRELVPCDVSGYNEVWPDGEIMVVEDPPGEFDFFADLGQVFARVSHQHPLVAIGRSGDRRSYKISDFLTRGQFHGLELYQDLYRRIGAEDQLAVSIPGRPLIGIAMNRGRRSFTERDRALLDLVAPHIAQAHARAIDQIEARALIAAMDEGLDEAGAAVVLLDRRGRVAHAGKRGLALLAAHRGRSDSGVTARELRVEGHEGAVLLLRESNGGPPSVDSLRALGLTPRQAEVLRLATMELSNEEIAAQLFISLRTVRKHLERIYARLGVNSRAAAVSRALR